MDKDGKELTGVEWTSSNTEVVEVSKTGYIKEIKVGTLTIVETNNSVSIDANGNAVDTTNITMTGSGNVDEIRYCYYNKATSSSCTISNIYVNDFVLPPTNVTSKTTYVIKAAPYYKGNKGKEVIKYVTIKGSGSTPTINDITNNCNLSSVDFNYDYVGTNRKNTWNEWSKVYNFENE